LPSNDAEVIFHDQSVAQPMVIALAIMVLDEFVEAFRNEPSPGAHAAANRAIEQIERVSPSAPAKVSGYKPLSSG
jgi:hypothetical protein